MKKTLFTFFAIFLSLFVFANETTTVTSPIFNWAEAIDGPGEDHVRSVRANNKGEIFTLSHFRDTKADAKISYKEHQSSGQKYDIKLYNTSANNIALHKIKKDGTLLWAVNSNFGDVYLNNCNVIPTNDGGALLLLKARDSSGKEHTDSLLLYKIVSASGVETEISLPATGEKKIRFYSPLLIKLTAEGEFEWHKLINIWHTPKMINEIEAPRTDCFSLHDGVTDEKGNFYLTGIFNDTIYWPKPDMTTAKMVPNNVSEWDGDTQAFRWDKNYARLRGMRCDFFILKLNEKGEHLWHRNTTGDEVKQIYSKRIAYEAGNVYIAGSINGYISENLAGDADPKTIKLGDKSLTVEKSDHLIFAKLSAENGDVDWFTQIKTAYPDIKSHHRMKPESLSVSGNTLLTGGSFSGGMIFGEGDTLKVGDAPGVKHLRGYALKLNAANGKFEASTELPLKDGIGEVRDIYLKDERIYAFDNARTMWVFNQNMERIGRFALLVGGEVFSASFVENDVFLLGRARRATIKFHGTDKSVTVKEWGNIIASFKIPDIIPVPSTVISLGANENNLIIYSGKGQIIIDAKQASPISVYSISGQMVMQFMAQQGRTVKTLAPGIYIVNRQKVIIL